MDNLCHALAGATLAKAGLDRHTPRALSTLIIASNLPDIDVAVFATDTLPMAFRRGWTHGVLAMIVLPAAFAAVVYAIDRATKAKTQAKIQGLLLLSYLAVLLHVFMDFLNSYGVRLLKPFSDRWFYGDALYIVDPILYVLFGGALLLGRNKGSRVPRLGFTLAAVYMLVMLASNLWARSVVRGGLDRAGLPADTRFMVTPVIGNPFRREVIVDLDSRYEKGFLWFEPLPHFRPAGYGVDKDAGHPMAQQAAQTRRGREYLLWARFPFYVVDPRTSRVQLNDYRYAGPGGRETWLSTTIDLSRPH
jgi:inner membrane protein